MNITGKYLTYNEYKSLGGNLSQMPFNLLEYKAGMEIDKYTFNRLNSLTTISDEIKLCTFELINLFNSINNGVETSENAINYDIKEINKQVKTIIINYLGNVVIDDTPVLYCGIE